jgi:hypothetical protein
MMLATCSGTGPKLAVGGCPTRGSLAGAPPGTILKLVSRCGAAGSTVASTSRSATFARS